MRLLIRLAGGTGTPLDLHVELAEDASVGELADHLAERSQRHLGPPDARAARSTLAVDVGTTRQRTLDSDEAVATAGPRSGATVALVDDAARTDHARSENARSDAAPIGTTHLAGSPVELVPPGGAPIRLPYGSTRVDGALIEVDERISIVATPGVVPSVNGIRVLDADLLAAGDLVWTGARSFEVRVGAPLRPPAPHGPREPVRRGPEHVERHEPSPVELPTPPGAVRLPGFPVLSAVVPLLMGAGLWLATRSAASAVFVLFSFGFVLASAIEARRESRAEARFREDEFRAELADRVATAERLRTAERGRADRRSPTVGEVARMVVDRSDRLWERSADAGMGLHVRLGTASLPAVDPVVVPHSGRRDLLAQLRSVAAGLERTELPVTVDLDEARGLALVGVGAGPAAVGRAVLVQLAALLPPEELSIRVLAGPEPLGSWGWCEWLPHCGGSTGAARTVLVVDGADPSQVAAAVESTPGSVRVVWLSASSTGLPKGIGAILVTDPGGRLTLVGEDGTVDEFVEEVSIEDLSLDEAVVIARSLAPLVHLPTLDIGPTAGSPRPSALPSEVGLATVTCRHAEDGALDDPDALLHRWERAARTGSLGAPLGLTDRGVLNVDLRLDGPHALVAGTTGSGKSELLRTLVASLAVHHSPDRLSFLLVDYKGGAAFSSLTELPHTVGLITDLDDALALRALRSLRAEVRQREVALAGHGAADLAELDALGVPDRPAALAVVVDEFATLARELPDFVDGLVDVAQRGRSLGIHLVLATQRPAGVVTDSIRANTSLRIALRVADEEDSRDVVDSPDAAHLSRDAPGRAIVRTGPERSAAVQVAWSGGPLRRQARIRSWAFGEARRVDRGSTTGDATEGELEAVVRTARTAALRRGGPAPARPWVDPLPSTTHLCDVPRGARSGELHIGWVDLPDEQRREPLTIDLERDGGVLVLGASGSGRTTTLATVAAACAAAPFVDTSHIDAVHIHAIDSGRGLASIASMPHVGDVLAADDAERVLRLLRAAVDDMATRREDDHLGRHPRRLLVIDGFATFEELHERVNRGEALDLLGRLARDGRAVGIHLAVSALRRSEVPTGLQASLGWRIQLRCPSEDEAMMAGLPAAAADPATPPGRGHVGQDLVQVAVAAHDPPERSPRVAEPVPSLPGEVPLAAVQFGRCTGWQVPIGIRADDLRPAHLELDHHHAIVAGPPRSGVSTALATIAAGLPQAYLIGARPEGCGEAWTRVERWGTDPAAPLDLVEDALRSAESGTRTVLAVDDLPELLDRPGGQDLEARLAELLTLDPLVPLRIVIGAEVDALARCYSEAVTRVRSGRTGVLLQPDHDLHPGLLHASLPHRHELPPSPGRGWLLGPGTATALQLART